MRTLIALMTGLALTVSLAACQKVAESGVAADDMTMGSPTAKVTMIEYASVSCPHCAEWNITVFPAFKAKYIDTGVVRYVAREALTADPSIAAAGFLTARCAGKDKYFQVVDAIYRGQEEMFRTGQPQPVLLNIAKSAGLTEAQFKACIGDDKALAALNDRWNRYVKDDKINSTPTFVIDGVVYDKGGMSMSELDAAVAKAASGKAPS